MAPRLTIKELMQRSPEEIPATIYRKRKKYHELSINHRAKHRDAITKLLEQALEPVHGYLQSIGLVLGTVPIWRRDDFMDQETSEEQSMRKIMNPLLKIHNNSASDLIAQNEKIVEKMCRAKDEILLSDKNYEHFRRQTNANMPSIYHVRKARWALNASLYKIYRNDYGNYVDCEHKIRLFVARSFEKMVRVMPK